MNGSISIRERSLELSDLALFKTVAEAGGVTRAAHRLHRVQSNVTARVKRLESHLGVELFVRARRGMSLTPEGRRLARIYSELDLGPGGYAVASSTAVRRGVRQAIRRKLGRQR